MASPMSSLRKLWETLRGVDRRHMQFEIDIHRLFLLTSYNKLGATSETSVEEITELGGRMSFDEQRKQVQDNVHEQVTRISAAMDAILLESREKKLDDVKATEGTRNRPSGLSFAVGGLAPKTEQQNTLVAVETRPLKSSEVSTALEKSIGYTLELRPSQIDHKEAGQGVYLVGTAGPGAVVSMYPGVIYSPSQYRNMPGYPRMDIANSYLVSRYDGYIVDGQPWGCGGESRELWDGSCQREAVRKVQVDLNDSSSPSVANSPGSEQPTQEIKRKGAGLWLALCGTEERRGARKGSILERRNPLALAHYVNHPTQGLQPNVMLCPYDFIASDPNIRPYIPNVHFDDDNERMRRRGLLWVRDRSEEDSVELLSRNDNRCPVIRTLVLISTREIHNEELFLNYRLSNHRKWPSWYRAVDQEEDRRRWD